MDLHQGEVISEQRVVINKQEAVIREQQVTVVGEEEIIKLLRENIFELKKRLGLTSETSSKPPSSGTWVVTFKIHKRRFEGAEGELQIPVA